MSGGQDVRVVRASASSRGGGLHRGIGVGGCKRALCETYKSRKGRGRRKLKDMGGAGGGCVLTRRMASGVK